MSRINAQAKMEFYPTPEIEISKALSKNVFDERRQGL